MRSESAGEWSVSGDMTGQTWIDTGILALNAGWFPIYSLLQRRSIIMITFVNTGETSNRCSMLCDSLLGRKKEQLFPPGLNKQKLADKFNEFFITKITNIRFDLLEQDTRLSDTQPENRLIPNALAKF